MRAAPDDVVHFRQVVGVDVAQVGVALGVGAAARRLIAQLLVFKQRGHRIQAEAGDSPIQPETHGVEHGVLDRGIAPVQVGLLA